MKNLMMILHKMVEVYPAIVTLLIYDMFISRDLSQLSWELKQQENRSRRALGGGYIG
jgi:hypothetical protein